MSSCSSRVRETTPSRRPQGCLQSVASKIVCPLPNRGIRILSPKSSSSKKIVRVPTVIIGWEFLDGFWQTTQSLKRFSLQRSSVFQESEACNASSDRGQISRLWLNTLPLLESCAKEFKFIIDAPGSAAFRWFQMAAVQSGLGSCTPREIKASVDPPQSHFCLRSPKRLPLVPRIHAPARIIRSANFNHPWPLSP